MAYLLCLAVEMTKILNIVIIAVFIILGLIGVKYGATVGSHNKFSSELSSTQGTVMAFHDGLILIDFDKTIINSCGDTSIYSFATTPTNLVVQLKPLFIPEAKAEAFNDQAEGNMIIFPIYDVYAFFSKPGIYKIEVYIENDCNGLNNRSIALDPIALIVKPSTDESA